MGFAYTCDRCNALRVGTPSEVCVTTKTGRSLRVSNQFGRPLDLCHVCRDQLAQWLAGTHRVVPMKGTEHA